jgi:hypothetical protein
VGELDLGNVDKNSFDSALSNLEKFIFRLLHHYNNISIDWLELQPYTKLLRLNQELSKINKDIERNNTQ